MPKWVKWTLIGLLAIVVLYLIGFLIFGFGSDSAGPLGVAA